jgi:hypothetical protein
VRKIARMIVRNASLMLMLALAACASAPAADPEQNSGHAPVNMGESFTLLLGDSARIVGTSLVLMFVEVTEDSRCARNVTCVWEGNARVKLSLVGTKGGKSPGTGLYVQDLEINTSSRFERRVKLPGGFVEMRGLEPQPPVGDPGKYAVTLYLEPDP